MSPSREAPVRREVGLTKGLMVEQVVQQRCVVVKAHVLFLSSFHRYAKACKITGSLNWLSNATHRSKYMQEYLQSKYSDATSQQRLCTRSSSVPAKSTAARKRQGSLRSDVPGSVGKNTSMNDYQNKDSRGSASHMHECSIGAWEESFAPLQQFADVANGLSCGTSKIGISRPSSAASSNSHKRSRGERQQSVHAQRIGLGKTPSLEEDSHLSYADRTPARASSSSSATTTAASASSSCATGATSSASSNMQLAYSIGSGSKLPPHARRTRLPPTAVQQQSQHHQSSRNSGLIAANCSFSSNERCANKRRNGSGGPQAQLRL